MNPVGMRVLSAIVMIASIIVAGALLFNYLEDGWTFLDSVYFVVTTIFTVGYGDIVPSPENRIITGFFIMVVCTVTLACSAVIGNSLIAYVQRRAASHRKNKEIASVICRSTAASDNGIIGMITDSDIRELERILDEIDLDNDYETGRRV